MNVRDTKKATEKGRPKNALNDVEYRQNLADKRIIAEIISFPMRFFPASHAERDPQKAKDASQTPDN